MNLKYDTSMVENSSRFHHVNTVERKNLQVPTTHIVTTAANHHPHASYVAVGISKGLVRSNIIFVLHVPEKGTKKVIAKPGNAVNRKRIPENSS